VSDGKDDLLLESVLGDEFTQFRGECFRGGCVRGLPESVRAVKKSASAIIPGLVGLGAQPAG